MWELDKYSSNTAFTDEYGKSVTYEMLSEEADKIYGAIGHRCLVFSLCQNSLGSVIGYVSFINSRVVPVLLNSELERELLLNLLSVYKPAFIWMPEEMFDSFSDVTNVYSSYGYILAKTSYDMEYPLYEDLCLLLTTSGSTGSPKFVRQSYKNVRANAESIAEYLELDSTEKPITTLPMNYTYGLSIINSHLLVGAEILVTDKGLMQK